MHAPPRSSTTQALRVVFLSLVWLLPLVQASWASDLADRVGSFLSSSRCVALYLPTHPSYPPTHPPQQSSMGQAASGGGKPFGEAASQIISKDTTQQTCTEGDGGGPQRELATFAAGCFWSGT